jgi:hypothetical protein
MREDDRKVWVLDTETKGTGAEMVPLEKLQRRRRATRSAAPTSVIRRTRPSEGRPSVSAPEPEVRAPRRFKVVGVMSGEVVADELGPREVIEAMGPFGSVFDVRIYVWEPLDEDWRLLSLGERKAIWARRGRRTGE